MISFTVLMTAPAGHFDPAVGLLWPVVGDSRLRGTRVSWHPFSALSATARAANSYWTPARVWFVGLFATNWSSTVRCRRLVSKEQTAFGVL